MTVMAVAVAAQALALGRLPAPHQARARQELAGRVLGIDAALDRVTVPAQLVLTPAQRLTAATRSCSATRSMPVSISVTGCSTWIRVFISRK
jgi:hypothetical protein